MAGSFLTMALSAKDSLVWDYKIPRRAAAVLICLLPLAIFLLGVREFIAVINVVGGIFVSLEILLVLLIYWRAKQLGDLSPGKYQLHHSLLLVALLLFALTIGAAYSVARLF